MLLHLFPSVVNLHCRPAFFMWRYLLGFSGGCCLPQHGRPGGIALHRPSPVRMSVCGQCLVSRGGNLGAGAQAWGASWRRRRGACEGAECSIPAANQPLGGRWLASSLDMCPVLRLASGCSAVTPRDQLLEAGSHGSMPFRSGDTWPHSR